jgi:hypothetical protein
MKRLSIDAIAAGDFSMKIVAVRATDYFSPPISRRQRWEHRGLLKQSRYVPV